MTGNIAKDSNGNPIKIEGHFKQCDRISDKLVQRFYEAGISKQELKPFLAVSDDEDYTPSSKSSYTGSMDSSAIDHIFEQVEGSHSMLDDYYGESDS